MLRIFDGDVYHVLTNDDILIFRPNNAEIARTLILTPPGVKPQFYSILAVLLAKSGIEVIMPRSALPCNPIGIRRLAVKLIQGYDPDLLLVMGFRLSDINKPIITIAFNEEASERQLVRSYVPGSARALIINDCVKLMRDVVSADLMISEELPALSTVIRIRDFVLNRVNALRMGK
ncbi:MAG: hypothetical protein ACP5GY_05475 [Vulcanisaeta sp.]